MNKILLILSMFIAISCATDTDRNRRMKMSELSYASGCYQASIYICEKYLKAPEKFSCYEEMNGLCPDGGKRWRAWLEDGKK